MTNRIIIALICFSFINIYFSNNVNAKYVYTKTETIFKIQNADNILPEINGRNYNVYDEKISENITINFSDNIGIKYSKYWYKEDNNKFLDSVNGIDFKTGLVCEKSGYYKIEVCDLYNNKIEYTFVIDKEINKSEVGVLYEDDNQVILKINCLDFVSGIEKIEVYKDGNLFEKYNSSSDNIKEILEEMAVNKTALKFYEEIYIICYDKFGNNKKSNSIYVNQDKIYTLEDLFRFNNIINKKIDDFSGKIVYLENSLDMSLEKNKKWISIIEFKGEFNGKNHTISGFYMDTNVEKSGFFGINYGKIRDLTIIGELKSTSDISAGICAENYGVIYNCRSKVTINSTKNYVGGICGINYGTIELCKNNYDILITGNYSGGIVGYNKTTGMIKKCGNSGNITSNNYAGGVCGFLEGNQNNINIEQSFSMGTIKSNSYVGGICGGTSGTVNMNYLYNRGDIIELSNKGNNGGIIGNGDNNITIKKAYNLGNITSSKCNQIAPSKVKVEESYYILGKMNNSGSGTGKSEYLFKELISNTNSILYLLSKNTNNVWSIKYGYNDGYPLFMWQL